MQITFFDLKRQDSQIKNEINKAINRILNRHFFILGKELENFENNFAQYLRIKFACGVASGTDGLIIALKALEIGPGDEVITTPFSFIATTLGITEVGAKPVFVDINHNTYQINVDQLERKISNKTKAILPVHLYGAPCDIGVIIKLAKKYKLKVIEDACQAHGAKVNNKVVGTFGDVSVFSFYPSKNLGAYGDGGAICTNNKKIYQKILQLRNYGQRIKYYHDYTGRNSRLDEIQAAILNVKLRYLNQWNRQRKQIASYYFTKLSDLKFQQILSKSESCYHLFTIEVERRPELINFLKSNGIQTLIHYPVPIHLQKCYKYLGYKKGDFPISERIADNILSLPFFPELTKKEIEYVCRQIRGFMKQ